MDHRGGQANPVIRFPPSPKEQKTAPEGTVLRNSFLPLAYSPSSSLMRILRKPPYSPLSALDTRLTVVDEAPVRA